MRLYPAIDIRGGKCVRLKQGSFEDVTVYSENPLEVAKYFCDCGAKYIHMVDLDGAVEGCAVNAEVFRKVADEGGLPIEVGGGVRSMEDIDAKLATGIDRVIIGTKAVSDPSFVSEAIAKYGPEKIVIGIDAKNGMVAVNGWEEVSEVPAIEMAKDMKERGVTTIIYTDISRDGMLVGPNVEYTAKMAKESGLTVIASGGVGSMKDLEDLKNAGVKGVIIGKAIYEKKIDLREAVRLYEDR